MDSQTITLITDHDPRPTAEYAVLVPTALNDGTPVDAYTRDLLEEKLLKDFGGYTNDGVHTGAWRDPDTDRIYYDQAVRYLIATDRPRDVIHFAAHVADVLDQQSVYVRYPDNTVKFVERAKIAAD